MGRKSLGFETSMRIRVSKSFKDAIEREASKQGIDTGKFMRVAIAKQFNEIVRLKILLKELIPNVSEVFIAREDGYLYYPKLGGN